MINSNLSEYSTMTYDTDYGFFKFHKVGRLCSMYIANPKNLTANGSTTINIGVDQKFLSLFDNVWIFSTANTTPDTIRVTFKPDGTLEVYNYSSSTGTFNINDTVCYISKN